MNEEDKCLESLLKPTKCVCGEPSDTNVVHRSDAPCYCKSQPSQPDPRDEALRLAKMALDEVLDLISESEGVFGLHLNGDLAPWGEIEQGGFFERLSTLPEALAAIDDALKGDN